jgi:hypothetical protein
MCTRTGGTYNHLNSNPDRSNCEPLDKCLISKVGVVTSASSCNNPFVSREISPTQYICHWCNQNAN